MAPRTKKKDAQPEDDRPFPEDGDPYVPPEGDTEDPDNDGEEGDDDQQPDPVEALRQQMADQGRVIDGLRQQIAVGNQPPKQPDPPDDFYDKADEKLFQEPGSFLKSFEDRIVKAVTGKVTQDYTKDQNEKTLWNDFYQKHPDLKADDDLVKATMQGNMGKLGGLPVSEAMEMLADLTRDRISRYAKTPRDRPRVEGSRPPSPRPNKPEPDKVITLSDIIRNRRAKRGVAKGA